MTPTTAPGAVRDAGLRGPRGLVVGVFSGLGASTAHLLGGGHTAVAETTIVTVLAVLAGLALARRRLGLAPLVLLAVGSQILFHALMSGTSHSAGTAVGETTAHGMAGTSTPGLMLLTHAVVALLTVGLARGADQVLLDLARSLTRWILPRLQVFRAPDVPTRSRWSLDPCLLPSRRHLTSPASRRGPPCTPLLLVFSS